MKKRYYILTLVIVSMFGAMAAYAGLAPANRPGDDDKKKKTTIEKKIEITNENGEKTVKVTTKKDGKTTVETYSGAEADAFLEKQEQMSWSGNGNGNFHFKFNTDSLNGFSFNGLNHLNDSVWKQVEKEMEEAMKNLKENGFNFDMQINGMDFNFDSVFSNGNMFKFYQFDDQMGNVNKMLDSMMQHLNIQIDIDDQIKNEIENNGHHKSRTRVIIAHSVELENMPAKKGVKQPDVEDISFYPNPSEGDFTLRYESKDEDPIRISVKDITGREVYAETISAIGVIKRQIDLGNQPSGSYVLNLQQGKKSISKKLIVH
ncbi:MAG: T9SS type A sorting domain-containing protein [Flavobacteriales bacterium]